MSNSSFKTLSTVIIVSLFSLWGCATNAPKTSPAEGEAPAPVQEDVAAQVAEAKPPTGEGAVGEKEVKEEVQVDQAPAVETMPAKEVSPPIAVESMPAQAQAVEGSAEAAKDVVAADASEGATALAATAEGAATADVPKKLAPGQHVITLVKKDSRHPAYGKGHPMGFSIDGVPGKSIVLERGKTYRFEIRTDPKHDVYLSSKEIGWGSSPVVEGVQGAYIYNGTMTFTPGKNTPGKVYYACRNHPYMGATLYIVNPGETVKIETPVAAAAAAPKQAQQVSEAKVKQKLMFADMMINGKGAKRVLASSNAEAKRLLAAAQKDLAASREKVRAGALPEALALADKAVKGVSAATRMVPNEDTQALDAQRYDELQHEVRDFEASYESNYKRIAKAGSVPQEVEYDQALVARLKAEAEDLAAKGAYAKANAKLEQAQAIVTKAIHSMLDSKTLVYELKFDSPADEFDYELKRFTGYEELVPVAVEMKKPAAGALSLMDSFLEKARKRRDEAKDKAASGDYGAAIAMMQQATKTVRRALRMVGVSQ